MLAVATPVTITSPEYSGDFRHVPDACLNHAKLPSCVALVMQLSCIPEDWAYTSFHNEQGFGAFPRRPVSWSHALHSYHVSFTD